MLSKEELLKPRYEVINNYPDCDKYNHFVGSIISFEFYEEESKQYYNRTFEGKIYDAFYDAYPHLFRCLEWWKRRSEDDMPEYVKMNDVYFKVADYNNFELSGIWFTAEGEPKNSFIHFIANSEPATESEYTNYIKSKK